MLHVTYFFQGLASQLHVMYTCVPINVEHAAMALTDNKSSIGSLWGGRCGFHSDNGRNMICTCVPINVEHQYGDMFQDPIIKTFVSHVHANQSVTDLNSEQDVATQILCKLSHPPLPWQCQSLNIRNRRPNRNYSVMISVCILLAFVSCW